jgi:hypothetical protein
MNPLNSNEVSFNALKQFWEVCEYLPPRERVWMSNALIAALSFMIPRDVWEDALTKATKAVLYQRKEEHTA